MAARWKYRGDFAPYHSPAPQAPRQFTGPATYRVPRTHEAGDCTVIGPAEVKGEEFARVVLADGTRTLRAWKHLSPRSAR